MHTINIAHSFLAILAGFITTVGLAGIVAALMKRFLTRSDARDPLAMAAQVSVSFLCATLGGYVTAFYTHGNLLPHTLMLALAVLLMSALSTLQAKHKQPVYFLILLIAIPPLAVLCGGLLRLHQMGLRW